ncbi:MAG TPA: heme-binding domain-containing protein [Bryobacteraceae bacterium]|nr:heme-binding domain-containing protein [Bryobacteraceae bacterium]
MIRRLAWIAGFFIVIQLIPYGHQHTNPPVVKEPAWDSPQTRELAKRACFDCHSNETTWPWYSNVAPVSWLVQDDVDGGRHHMNFSEWNQPQRHSHDAVKDVQDGDMPLWFYLPMHPKAKLTADEKAALIAGFKKMPGFAPDQDKD